MKLHSKITINGRVYRKGDEIAWYTVYPFFLIHMLMFGLSGFFMAYSSNGAPGLFLFAHGGIAITVYTVFYFALFGLDEVKWMFINAGLGLLGIYTQIDWILALFGKDIRSYSPWVHVVPFLYFILYTFLIRQMILDLTGFREDEEKKKTAEKLYVISSVVVYVGSYLLQRHF